MQDEDATDDPDLSHALDAWSALTPPAEFAARVLAAREADAPPKPPRRWRRAVIVAAVTAAAATAATILRTPARATTGALRAELRTTAALGARGVAVAEAASELTWRIDDRGATEVTQRAGDVFYRVEPGGPFVVHTPAGDIRVTGTCFRVEVEAMNSKTKLILSGLAGAAAASAVLITVYEGRVTAETRSAKTELAAGTHATLRSDVTVVDSTAPGASADADASREQLLARTRAQQAELSELHARLAQLEHPVVASDDGADANPPFHDQSSAQLTAWVATCRVRFDTPELDHGILPPASGVAAGEIDAFNAAMTESDQHWHDLVRNLYIETTGDEAGADSMSLDAMRQEIQAKSAPGENLVVWQRLARERAGLDQAPADLSKASPFERLLRAWATLGDQAEAALARRIGRERAHAIRGDSWGGKSVDVRGCPAGK